MRSPRFSVATELSVSACITRREARSLVAAMTAELARLRRSDRRIRKITRRSRVEPGHRVGFVIEVVASDPLEAYDIANAALRSSLHAAGGSTVGWEWDCPRVARVVEPRSGPGRVVGRSSASRPGTRSRAPMVERPLGALAGGRSSWAARSAEFARRAASYEPLPPFGGPSAPQPVLIDLR